LGAVPNQGRAIQSQGAVLSAGWNLADPARPGLAADMCHQDYLSTAGREWANESPLAAQTLQSPASQPTSCTRSRDPRLCGNALGYRTNRARCSSRFHRQGSAPSRSNGRICRNGVGSRGGRCLKCSCCLRAFLSLLPDYRGSGGLRGCLASKAANAFKSSFQSFAAGLALWITIPVGAIAVTLSANLSPG
jgi:hypothetical protein